MAHEDPISIPFGAGKLTILGGDRGYRVVDPVRERRVAYFSVDPKVMLDLVTGKAKIEIEPTDAVFVRCFYEPMSDSIHFVVAHPSFVTVPVGERMGAIYPLVRTVRQEVAP